MTRSASGCSVTKFDDCNQTLPLLPVQPPAALIEGLLSKPARVPPVLIIVKSGEEDRAL